MEHPDTYAPAYGSHVWIGITLDWAAVSASEAYQVQVDTSASFNPPMLLSDTTANPNPIADPVRVQGMDARMELRVHDALGHVVPVLPPHVASDAVELDLSAAPAGMYTLSSVACIGHWHTLLLKQ